MNTNVDNNILYWYMVGKAKYIILRTNVYKGDHYHYSGQKFPSEFNVPLDIIMSKVKYLHFGLLKKEMGWEN